MLITNFCEALCDNSYSLIPIFKLKDKFLQYDKIVIFIWARSHEKAQYTVSNYESCRSAPKLMGT